MLCKWIPEWKKRTEKVKRKMGGRRPTAEALRPIIKVTSKKIKVEIEISTKSYKMKKTCDAKSKNNYQIILCCKIAKFLSTWERKWGLLYINEIRSLWLNVIYVQQTGVYTAVWRSFLCYCTLGYGSGPLAHFNASTRFGGHLQRQTQNIARHMRLD